MKRPLGRIVLSVLVFALVAGGLTGCANMRDFRKKFVRKKAQKEVPVIITQFDEGAPLGSFELYQRHYTYCAAWCSEAARDFGPNRQKNETFIEQIVSNLADMKKFVTSEKGAELDELIAQMHLIRARVEKGTPMGQVETGRYRRTFESTYRLLRRKFYYRKMTPYLIETPAPGLRQPAE